ncbi:hypothetical protein K490DRAFT_59647 [Saccharata proteae CBS 121410]|uniref:Uncharacterized protein n=1 Tax=Saccharata proteae CBS 121410 TaxID=1314787 RepID=A0A9P4LSB0_9PEZI|nr:hypothetical protein K490DRAFT_59647 [Saccharata proteae CBS 121410]
MPRSAMLSRMRVRWRRCSYCEDGDRSTTSRRKKRELRMEYGRMMVIEDLEFIEEHSRILGRGRVFKALGEHQEKYEVSNLSANQGLRIKIYQQSSLTVTSRTSPKLQLTRERRAKVYPGIWPATYFALQSTHISVSPCPLLTSTLEPLQQSNVSMPRYGLDQHLTGDDHADSTLYATEHLVTVWVAAAFRESVGFGGVVATRATAITSSRGGLEKAVSAIQSWIQDLLWTGLRAAPWPAAQAWLWALVQSSGNRPNATARQLRLAAQARRVHDLITMDNPPPNILNYNAGQVAALAQRTVDFWDACLRASAPIRALALLVADGYPSGALVHRELEFWVWQRLGLILEDSRYYEAEEWIVGVSELELDEENAGNEAHLLLEARRLRALLYL